jgi:hypothetical protein
VTDTDPELLPPKANDAKDAEREKAVRERYRAGRVACMDAIGTLLKNWAGLISFAADQLALRSLVETLRVSPHTEVKACQLTRQSPLECN